MHAHALEVLEPFLKPGNKALDVGSGSGYLTACMAHMVKPDGKVIGIEHIPELVNKSKLNVGKGDKELLENGTVELVVGDGREGFPREAPYDAIHVGAAAHPVPKALLDQLKAPGRMVIPVDNGLFGQTLCQYDKDANGTIQQTKLMDVIYVPLTDRDAQLDGR
ncbi:Protein-L-isoaspartate(D-aspartate) O-methyltransferase [Borealophlyctis nickersoniae]|nr:Protein-L-isoaspartate(D-aspartate) O-methyltransferase [Borealophlyctis nickersoniae]